MNRQHTAPLPGDGRQGRLARQRGLTLLEVVVTLSIVGLLTAAAMSEFDIDPYKGASEAEQLEAALRYAQSLGVSQTMLGANQRVIWGLNITGNSYTLQLRRAGNTTSPINLQGARDADGNPVTSPTHTLQDSVSISAGTGDIFFNFRGQPVANNGAVLAVNRTISVRTDGGDTVNLTVIQDSGYIR